MLKFHSSIFLGGVPQSPNWQVSKSGILYSPLISSPSSRGWGDEGFGQRGNRTFLTLKLKAIVYSRALSLSGFS